jgi:hypothetical protein
MSKATQVVKNDVKKVVQNLKPIVGKKPLVPVGDIKGPVKDPIKDPVKDEKPKDKPKEDARPIKEEPKLDRKDDNPVVENKQQVKPADWKSAKTGGGYFSKAVSKMLDKRGSSKKKKKKRISFT